MKIFPIPLGTGTRAERRSRLLFVAALGVGTSLGACGSDSEDAGGPGGDGDLPSGDGDGGGDGDGDTAGTGSTNGDGDLVVPASGGGDGDGSGLGGAGPVCESASSEAKLAPVLLAFAFDVSGSMGKYDHPYWWHDPDAKWTPVRQATQTFFADATSAGISASMAFFPRADDSCDASSYEVPEVPMTTLPSDIFSTAFDDYEAEVGTPLAGGDWRGGTPTLPAFTGTSAYLTGLQAENPEAQVAVVLVTDGLPQSCDGNDVQAVSAAAAALYADGSGTRTYVIGIENPTTPPASLPTYDDWDNWGCGEDDGEPCVPPDTLGALDEIAASGGTTEAFLIDTGDPVATQAAFRAAIEAIRSQSVSCELEIPPNPNGGTFDPDKIDVTYTVGGQTTRLDYDPLCEVGSSWHYDDEADPSFIQLCSDTCALVQSLPAVQLDVAFLCEDRPDVVR